MAVPAPGPSFPRPALIGAAGLVVVALVGAVLGREPATGSFSPISKPEIVRELRFADRADGAVLVQDARDGRTIAVETGQNGFLRATMRGFAQQRLRVGIGSARPFRLTAWADGRLTLEDPATGRHTDLEAFGPTNEAVFARLLTAQPVKGSP